jgi:predicted phage-related endonuclease
MNTTTPTEPFELVYGGSNDVEWLMHRKGGLGASEAPAIMALSPWQTPHDVQVDKLATYVTDEQTEALDPVPVVARHPRQ